MAEKNKQARALIAISMAGLACACGQVFEAPAAHIKALVKDGLADDNQEAIAAGLAENSTVAVYTQPAVLEAETQPEPPLEPPAA